MPKFARPLVVLAVLCLWVAGSRAQGSPTVFINEIHYDNAGTDTGESIEIAGPAGTNLTGYSLVLYNGSTPTSGVVYNTRALSGVIPSQQGGYGTLAFAYGTDGIQNGGNDGVALVLTTTTPPTVVQFLSYEGVVTASAGPAAGMTSTDIGVTETGTTPIGHSVQLTGTGSGASAFSWTGPLAKSDGAPNAGQTFTGVIGPDDAPSVTSTSPANGAVDVDPAANIVINFSEPVTATTSAFTLQCGSMVTFGQTSGVASSFVLDPNVALAASTLCTVTVTAAEVSDADVNDPPDNPVENQSFSFTTAAAPPASVFINEVDADTPGAGFDLAEFVELYDGGVGNTPLDGLTVVFYNGSSDTSYAAFDLDGYSTNGSGYFTLGNPGVAGVDIEFLPGEFGFLQNGQDAVAVVIGNAASFPNGTPLSTGNVIDALVYDTDEADDPQLLALLNAGQPQVNENAGGDAPNQSSGRCADGTGGLRNTSTYRAGAPSPDGPNNCPGPSNSPIVISQIYGSGGNDGALYQNDYVELYNRGDAIVDVTGWSVQYAAAAGTSWANKVPLGGPIAPGQYYLVKLATSDATVGAPLPAPNVTGPINMSGTNGKVALVNAFDSLLGECPLSSPHLMDLVGYGSATCGEGNTKAPALSPVTADLRINDGRIDTDRNFEDFLSGAPNPRRTAPIVELGPFLLASDPSPNFSNVPRDPTLVFTFSEPVTVVGQFFNLTCAVTGEHDSYTLAGSAQFVDVTLNVNLLAGENCTITVFKDQVHDQDADDTAPGTDTLPGNYSWSFTVASGTPPPYAPDVHLTFGNPTGATTDLGQPQNYLMEKPEFALSYNRDLGRPNWVSWHLSAEWTGTLARVDTFRADPAVSPDWYRVQAFDFSGSGFDRGHMVPNADRDKQTSVPINQATFLMTNMVAQAPGNNQGPWADLEGYLRTLTDAGSEIYIVAGPQGTGGKGTSSGDVPTMTIANGHVAVPANTWKVALILPMGGNDVSRVSCSTRTIAVIMPNVDSIREITWETYLTSVDEVEELTGYDLFANLPDGVEYCVEAGVNGANPPADLDPPVVQCASPDGLWHGDNVALACTATDSASGLLNAGDAAFTLMTMVASGAETANAATDSRVICDRVGNCATAGPIAGNRIDRKGPEIAVASPLNAGVYQFNKTALAAFNCADGGSGVASCTGTVANGAAFDTAAVGTKSFAVTATDAVGNSSSTTVSYKVAPGNIEPNPTIIITNIPATAVAGGSFTPVIAYTGDGATHLRSATPAVCQVDGDTRVIFVGAGTCTVSAWATPSGSYARVDGPFQSFIVQ